MTCVLGLTGGIASGKTTVATFFKSSQIPVIDSDQLAREVLEVGQPAWQKVKQHFGAKYFNPDQSINRKFLGNLIFNDPKERQLLNKITHPLIFKRTDQLVAQFKKRGVPIIVVDVPLLFETLGDSRLDIYDAILVVAVPKKTQCQRLMVRDRLTYEQALKRIDSQMPLLRKCSLATYILSNTGSLAELSYKLTNLLTIIKGGL